MATPGYPQMQPGQHPQMMQGGPMGAMPNPRVVKRGVSKAVPVVVSAGLAVGVFCGLLFGLGTGDATAHAAEPSKGNNLKAATTDKEESGVAPAGLGATAALPPPKPASGSAATVSATGSGTSNPVATATGSNTGSAGSAAGSGAGSAVAAAGSNAGSAAAANSAKLTIEVEPAAAASIAKISIDGKEITGSSIELPADKKSVKVSIAATGFHSIDNKKVDVTAGADTKVQIELTKRASGGSPGFGGASTGGNHVPTAPPRPKKPPNAGIIDI